MLSTVYTNSNKLNGLIYPSTILILFMLSTEDSNDLMTYFISSLSAGDSNQFKD